MTNQLSEIHKARLRETLNQVEVANKHNTWNQGAWGEVSFPTAKDEPCGTAFCFAGHAARTYEAEHKGSGFRLLWSGSAETFGAGTEDYVGFFIDEATEKQALAFANKHRDLETEVHAREVRLRGDNRQSISEWAADYFGISEYAAGQLFNGFNTLQDLRMYVNNLIETGDIHGHRS